MKPDAVSRQYERFVYPPPLTDLGDAMVRRGLREPSDPSLVHLALWPTRAKCRKKLAILVAGCGAGQAALIAATNKSSGVTAIDVSRAALAETARLAEGQGLVNLALHRLAVEDAGTLGIRFDFVLATGVLHHLRDPVAGLRSLRDVLAPEGVIAIMLYGRYGRMGAGMVQEMLRLLRLRRSRRDLATARRVVADMARDHPAQPFIRRYGQFLPDDAEFVDTFLPARERTYTVGECLALVSEAGLRFMGWQDNHRYYPEATLRARHPARVRMQGLEEAEIWKCMELLQGNLTMHSFFACRTDRPERRFRLDWDAPGAMLRAVPHRRYDAAIEGEDPPVAGRRGRFRTELDDAEHRLLRQVDGRRSTGACLRRAGVPETDGVLALRRLWRMGLVLVQLPRRR